MHSLRHFQVRLTDITQHNRQKISLGAISMDDWTIYRLDSKRLKKLCEK